MNELTKVSDITAQGTTLFVVSTDADAHMELSNE